MIKKSSWLFMILVVIGCLSSCGEPGTESQLDMSRFEDPSSIGVSSKPPWEKESGESESEKEAAIILDSSNSSAGSQQSSASSLTSDQTAFPRKTVLHLSELPSGNTDDTLKKYEAVTNSTQYDAYTLEGWMETTRFISKHVAFLPNEIGSTFLTDLQRMPVQQESPEIPDDGFVLAVSVADDKSVYRYYFFENGMVFAEQNGKRYYLGNNPMYVHSYTMIFYSTVASTITQEQSEVPVLPELGTGQGTKMPSAFTDEYQIAYVATGYGDLYWATLITNEAHRAYVTNAINAAITSRCLEDTQPGGGNVIRIFKGKGCYDFAVSGDKLYVMTENNRMYYEIPRSTTIEIQYIAAQAIAEKIKA